MSHEQHSIGDTVVRVKEIAKPLKTPLTGWRKPRITEPKEPKPKALYDDPLVHELLGYLRSAANIMELDGQFLPNYNACKELVRRCQAKGNDPEEVLKSLVDVAVQDPYRGPSVTNWRYLLNNAAAIFKAHLARSKDPKTQSPYDRQRELAEATERVLARRRSENATVTGGA